ncbi:MAG: hypothetical protein R6V10_08240 [bacterium]
MEIIAIVILAAILIAGLLVFVSLKRVVDLELENRDRFAKLQEKLNSIENKLTPSSREGENKVE